MPDNLLDPKYDYDFTEIDDKEKKFMRGGLEYKRPCGWKRYALKVREKYNDIEWLGKKENQKMILNGCFLSCHKNLLC